MYGVLVAVCNQNSHVLFVVFKVFVYAVTNIFIGIGDYCWHASEGLVVIAY